MEPEAEVDAGTAAENGSLAAAVWARGAAEAEEETGMEAWGG